MTTATCAWSVAVAAGRITAARARVFCHNPVTSRSNRRTRPDDWLRVLR
jgi:hypothetical protein